MHHATIDFVPVRADAAARTRLGSVAPPSAPDRTRAELPPGAGLFIATLVSALLWSAPAGAVLWLLG